MMKNIKCSLLLLLFLLINIGSGYAHALYIDTQVQGKLGKKHEVRVYYSEFEDRTHEKLSDWYSDVAKFELWLVKPDGGRIQLQTTAQEDHFITMFVPAKEGSYRLEISHTAEDPGDQTAYQFNAFAQVLVGMSSPVPPLTVNGSALVLIEDGPSADNAKTKTFKTYWNGEPKAEVSTTIFLPSGETKKVESNAEGVLKIELEEEGTYFLEATTYHKNEPGKTKKAAFQSVWRCATQKFEI